MLNENDFSFDDEVSLATLDGDVEKVEAEILSDPEEFEKFSLSAHKKNKEALANLRAKLALTADQRKLQESEKVLKAIEFLDDIISDPEKMRQVKDSVTSAKDLKFIADAQSKFIENHRWLMRADSIDGFGTPKKFSIGVRYEDDTGTKIDTVIKNG